MSKPLIAALWALALLFTASTLWAPYPGSFVVKLLPMVLLLTVARGVTGDRAGKLFFAGLVFSALGDLLLDLDRQRFFVFGLGAFLVAHVLYIVAFLPLQKKQLPLVGAYLVYGVVIFSQLAPGLGELFVPVSVYMVAVISMGIVALVSARSNPWLAAGGLSFVVSDSLIGVDKFLVDLPQDAMLVMPTYYLAQFCLVMGVLRWPKIKE